MRLSPSSASDADGRVTDGLSTATHGTPAASSRGITLSQHHAPCHAPCTSTPVAVIDRSFAARRSLSPARLICRYVEHLVEPHRREMFLRKPVEDHRQRPDDHRTVLLWLSV